MVQLDLRGIGRRWTLSGASARWVSEGYTNRYTVSYYLRAFDQRQYDQQNWKLVCLWIVKHIHERSSNSLHALATEYLRRKNNGST